MSRKIETIIGPNTNFKGKLVCQGNVRIEGVCEASGIETRGDVVISSQARVVAHLVANNVSVSGIVLGK